MVKGIIRVRLSPYHKSILQRILRSFQRSFRMELALALALGFLRRTERNQGS